MSDNGLQFFARDFKKFIRIAGLTHLRTSPQLSAEQREDRALAQVAQSWLHPPWSPQDARRLVSGFVEHYNTVRLHSAIGYITPADKLAGKEEAIFAARDQTPPGPERPIKLDVTKSTPTH